MDQTAGQAGDWEIAHPRLIFYLNQANHAVRSRLEAALAKIEVTGIQFTVLSVIGAHDGMSSAELSRRFFVTPQTMNELIGGLHKRGLILRKEDPANRRILRMSLTPEGRKLIAACEEVADAVERDVFGFMTAEQYNELRRLTRLVAQHLRARDEAQRDA
ncbi:MarR family transcriptional regulator [Chelativorans sp.]|uniref:MarR family winged helix-turn-helix transcriptional regulator n=1 Tax=Chelativorans sp. TaxID=2203393 RepID=UPI002810D226|nr:MarR family transcriptional regulator [Chelativorans sp.]